MNYKHLIVLFSLLQLLITNFESYHFFNTCFLFSSIEMYKHLLEEIIISGDLKAAEKQIQIPFLAF